MVTLVAKALRPHVADSRAIATAIVAVSLRHSERPRRRRLNAKAKVRIRKRDRTGTVYGLNALNMRWSRVFGEGAAAVLAVTQLEVSPVYLALGALAIAAQLRSWFVTDLTERDGAIVYVLWTNGGQTRPRDIELLLPDVNRELRRLSKSRMGRRELAERLQSLTDLGCLTPSLAGWRLKDRIWQSA